MNMELRRVLEVHAIDAHDSAWDCKKRRRKRPACGYRSRPDQSCRYIGFTDRYVDFPGYRSAVFADRESGQRDEKRIFVFLHLWALPSLQCVLDSQFMQIKADFDRVEFFFRRIVEGNS